MENWFISNMGKITLEGILKVLPSVQGIVLFAHGSGSSRFSPHNNFVDSALTPQKH